jgi:hypothetical protein
MSDSKTYPIKEGNEPEAPIMVLLIYIAFGLITFILIFQMVFAIYSSQFPTDDTGAEESSIKVSALVLPSLGVKTIDSNAQNAVTVTGNYTNGFVLVDVLSGKSVFDSNKKPGNGMLVILPKNSENIYLFPKF